MRHYHSARAYLSAEARRSDEVYHITRGALVDAINTGLSAKSFHYLLNPRRVNQAISNILDHLEEFKDPPDQLPH